MTAKAQRKRKRAAPAPRWGTARANDAESFGSQVAALAELVGIPLLPWQKDVVDVAMEVDGDGRWLHPLTGIVVGRQNGKSQLLIMRMLHALFIGPERLTLFAAQDRAQSRMVFEQLLDAVDAVPALAAEVKHRRQQLGIEMLSLKDGSSLRILSTRQAAWRGYSSDLVVLDELREHDDRETWSAALYTQRARPNPQLWTASTAGNADSVVLRDLVDRGRAAVGDPASDSMAYFEYSADGIPDVDVSDPEVWRFGNPALDVLIQPSALEEELRSDPVGFLAESLCIWTDEAGGEPLVSLNAWDRCVDGAVDASGLESVVLGVDIDFDRTVGHLVAAGWNGRQMVAAVVESWMDPREAVVAERVKHWRGKLAAKAVALDSRTCAGIADRLVAVGFVPHRIGTRELSRAMSRLVEHVDRGTLTHAGDPALRSSLEDTLRITRPDGSWRLRRRDVTVPITAAMALLAAVDAAAAPRTVYSVH